MKLKLDKENNKAILAIHTQTRQSLDNISSCIAQQKLESLITTLSRGVAFVATYAIVLDAMNQVNPYPNLAVTHDTDVP
jgi:hypothetical protein